MFVLLYLEHVIMLPLREPNVDKATAMGMIKAKRPSSLLPKV